MKSRLLYGLALWASGAAHSLVVGGIENTPVGLFVYHMSAAMVDYWLLICAAYSLSGRLSTDMQNLCLFSMIINFIGWVLYMAYAPPFSYNTAIMALGYVQYIRLITTGIYGPDRAGDYLFRGHDSICSKLHYEKAQQ
jgi:hypothetical protein